MYRYTYIFADTGPLFVLGFVSRSYAASRAQRVFAFLANSWSVHSKFLEIFNRKIPSGFVLVTKNARVGI